MVKHGCYTGKGGEYGYVFLQLSYIQAKTFYFEIHQEWDEILTSYDSEARLFVFYTQI